MATHSLALGEEELRARRVDGLGAVAIHPPIHPTGWATTSSIESVGAPESPEERKRIPLEPPKHFMLGIIGAHRELERVADKQAKLFEAQSISNLQEIERLDAEKLETLRKQAESVHAQNTWGVLSNVAQYLMAGSAIVLGATVMVAAPWAGGLLLLSGALSLGARVMQDTGAFQAIAAWFTQSQELKKTLATKIEMGMFFLSLGLGIAGGAWAHNLGALASLTSRAAIIEKIVAGIGLGATLGKGVGDFGNAFAKKRTAHLEADITELEQKINQLHQDMTQQIKDVQNFIEMSADIGDEVKQDISGSKGTD